MMDVTRGPRGEVVIRIDETFDAMAAARLAAWLGEIPAEEPLVVEFGRDCLDLTLAAIAGELAARPALTLRGLSRHQEKLLRYLGLDLDGREPARAAG